MKSQIIENATYLPVHEKDQYSDLQVMKSGNGWYIGTTYYCRRDDYYEPGTRDTEYFGSEAQAIVELDLLERGKSNVVLRTHP